MTEKPLNKYQVAVDSSKNVYQAHRESSTLIRVYREGLPSRDFTGTEVDYPSIFIRNDRVFLTYKNKVSATNCRVVVVELNPINLSTIQTLEYTTTYETDKPFGILTANGRFFILYVSRETSRVEFVTYQFLNGGTQFNTTPVRFYPSPITVTSVNSLVAHNQLNAIYLAYETSGRMGVARFSSFSNLILRSIVRDTGLTDYIFSTPFVPDDDTSVTIGFRVGGTDTRIVTLSSSNLDQIYESKNLSFPYVTALYGFRECQVAVYVNYVSNTISTKRVVDGEFDFTKPGISYSDPSNLTQPYAWMETPWNQIKLINKSIVPISTNVTYTTPAVRDVDISTTSEFGDVYQLYSTDNSIGLKVNTNALIIIDPENKGYGMWIATTANRVYLAYAFRKQAYIDYVEVKFVVGTYNPSLNLFTSLSVVRLFLVDNAISDIYPVTTLCRTLLFVGYVNVRGRVYLNSVDINSGTSFERSANFLTTDIQPSSLTIRIGGVGTNRLHVGGILQTDATKIKFLTFVADRNYTPIPSGTFTDDLDSGDTKTGLYLTTLDNSVTVSTLTSTGFFLSRYYVTDPTQFVGQVSSLTTSGFTAPRPVLLTRNQEYLVAMFLKTTSTIGVYVITSDTELEAQADIPVTLTNYSSGYLTKGIVNSTWTKMFFSYVNNPVQIIPITITRTLQSTFGAPVLEDLDEQQVNWTKINVFQTFEEKDDSYSVHNSSSNIILAAISSEYNAYYLNNTLEYGYFKSSTLNSHLEILKTVTIDIAIPPLSNLEYEAFVENARNHTTPITRNILQPQSWITGTYNLSGGNMVVTRRSHGFVSGNSVYLTALTGTFPTSTYSITSADTNTFTVSLTGTSVGTVLINQYRFDLLDGVLDRDENGIPFRTSLPRQYFVSPTQATDINNIVTAGKPDLYVYQTKYTDLLRANLDETQVVNLGDCISGTDVLAGNPGVNATVTLSSTFNVGSTVTKDTVIGNYLLPSVNILAPKRGRVILDRFIYDGQYLTGSVVTIGTISNYVGYANTSGTLVKTFVGGSVQPGDIVGYIDSSANSITVTEAGTLTWNPNAGANVIFNQELFTVQYATPTTITTTRVGTLRLTTIGYVATGVDVLPGSIIASVDFETHPIVTEQEGILLSSVSGGVTAGQVVATINVLFQTIYSPTIGVFTAEPGVISGREYGANVTIGKITKPDNTVVNIQTPAPCFIDFILVTGSTVEVRERLFTVKLLTTQNFNIVTPVSGSFFRDPSIIIGGTVNYFTQIGSVRSQPPGTVLKSPVNGIVTNINLRGDSIITSDDFYLDTNIFSVQTADVNLVPAFRILETFGGQFPTIFAEDDSDFIYVAYVQKIIGIVSYCKLIVTKIVKTTLTTSFVREYVLPDTNPETFRLNAFVRGGVIYLYYMRNTRKLWNLTINMDTGVVVNVSRYDIYTLPLLYNYGINSTTTNPTPPVGSINIIPWEISPYPSEYLKCDGAAVSRTTFSTLFASIGTSFGSGDGVNTFNLPTLYDHGIRHSSSSTPLPAGSIVGLPWEISPYPTSYLKCDGSAVSRTTYSTLFGKIGTKYGSGDGINTFNLPTFSNHGIKIDDNNSLPVGLNLILPWVISPYPTGFLKCDGGVTTIPELYPILSDIYFQESITNDIFLIRSRDPRYIYVTFNNRVYKLGVSGGAVQSQYISSAITNGRLVEDVDTGKLFLYSQTRIEEIDLSTVTGSLVYQYTPNITVRQLYAFNELLLGLDASGNNVETQKIFLDGNIIKPKETTTEIGLTSGLTGNLGLRLREPWDTLNVYYYTGTLGNDRLTITGSRSFLLRTFTKSSTTAITNRVTESREYQSAIDEFYNVYSVFQSFGSDEVENTNTEGVYLVKLDDTGRAVERNGVKEYLVDRFGQAPAVAYYGGYVITVHVRVVFGYTSFLGIFVNKLESTEFIRMWDRGIVIDDTDSSNYRPRVRVTEEGVFVCYTRSDNKIIIQSINFDNGFTTNFDKTNLQISASSLSNQISFRRKNGVSYLCYPEGVTDTRLRTSVDWTNSSLDLLGTNLTDIIMEINDEGVIYLAASTTENNLTVRRIGTGGWIKDPKQSGNNYYFDKVLGLYLSRGYPIVFMLRDSLDITDPSQLHQVEAITYEPTTGEAIYRQVIPNTAFTPDVFERIVTGKPFIQFNVEDPEIAWLVLPTPMRYYSIYSTLNSKYTSYPESNTVNNPVISSAIYSHPSVITGSYVLRERLATVTTIATHNLQVGDRCIMNYYYPNSVTLKTDRKIVVKSILSTNQFTCYLDEPDTITTSLNIPYLRHLARVVTTPSSHGYFTGDKLQINNSKTTVIRHLSSLTFLIPCTAAEETTGPLSGGTLTNIRRDIIYNNYEIMVMKLVKEGEPLASDFYQPLSGNQFQANHRSSTYSSSITEAGPNNGIISRLNCSGAVSNQRVLDSGASHTSIQVRRDTSIESSTLELRIKQLLYKGVEYLNPNFQGIVREVFNNALLTYKRVKQYYEEVTDLVITTFGGGVVSLKSALGDIAVGTSQLERSNYIKTKIDNLSVNPIVGFTLPTVGFSYIYQLVQYIVRYKPFLTITGVIPPSSTGLRITLTSTISSIYAQILALTPVADELAVTDEKYIRDDDTMTTEERLIKRLEKEAKGFQFISTLANSLSTILPPNLFLTVTDIILEVCQTRIRATPTSVLTPVFDITDNLIDEIGLTDQTATYAISGTTCTITLANNFYGVKSIYSESLVDSYVYLRPTSGTLPEGQYLITSASSGGFTVGVGSGLSGSGGLVINGDAFRSFKTEAILRSMEVEFEISDIPRRYVVTVEDLFEYVIGDTEVYAVTSRKLVAFTAFTAISVQKLNPVSLDVDWYVERKFSDTTEQFYKPLIKVNEFGVYVTYTKEDRKTYLETFDRNTGVRSFTRELGLVVTDKTDPLINQVSGTAFGNEAYLTYPSTTGLVVNKYVTKNLVVLSVVRLLADPDTYPTAEDPANIAAQQLKDLITANTTWEISSGDILIDTSIRRVRIIFNSNLVLEKTLLDFILTSGFAYTKLNGGTLAESLGGSLQTDFSTTATLFTPQGSIRDVIVRESVEADYEGVSQALYFGFTGGSLVYLARVSLPGLITEWTKDILATGAYNTRMHGMVVFGEYPHPMFMDSIQKKIVVRKYTYQGTLLTSNVLNVSDYLGRNPVSELVVDQPAIVCNTPWSTPVIKFYVTTAIAYLEGVKTGNITPLKKTIGIMGVEKLSLNDNYSMANVINSKVKANSQDGNQYLIYTSGSELRLVRINLNNQVKGTVVVDTQFARNPVIDLKTGTDGRDYVYVTYVIARRGFTESILLKSVWYRVDVNPDESVTFVQEYSGLEHELPDPYPETLVPRMRVTDEGSMYVFFGRRDSRIYAQKIKSEGMVLEKYLKTSTLIDDTKPEALSVDSYLNDVYLAVPLSLSYQVIKYTSLTSPVNIGSNTGDEYDNFILRVSETGVYLTYSIINTNPVLYNHGIKTTADNPNAPTGSMVTLPWTISPYPTGFLKCDGAAVSRTTYSGLFTAIGTFYGPGDGSTTFNLPTLYNYGISTTNTNPLPTASTIILPWTISPYPTGYLKCDGSAVSRTTYSTLFASIGTSFGSGDGVNTFNLPTLFNHGIKVNGTASIPSGSIVQIPWVITPYPVEYLKLDGVGKLQVRNITENWTHQFNTDQVTGTIIGGRITEVIMLSGFPVFVSLVDDVSSSEIYYASWRLDPFTGTQVGNVVYEKVLDIIDSETVSDGSIILPQITFTTWEPYDAIGVIYLSNNPVANPRALRLTGVNGVNIDIQQFGSITKPVGAIEESDVFVNQITRDEDSAYTVSNNRYDPDVGGSTYKFEIYKNLKSDASQVAVCKPYSTTPSDYTLDTNLIRQRYFQNSTSFGQRAVVNQFGNSVYVTFIRHVIGFFEIISIVTLKLRKSELKLESPISSYRAIRSIGDLDSGNIYVRTAVKGGYLYRAFIRTDNRIYVDRMDLETMAYGPLYRTSLTETGIPGRELVLYPDPKLDTLYLVTSNIGNGLLKIAKFSTSTLTSSGSLQPLQSNFPHPIAIPDYHTSPKTRMITEINDDGIMFLTYYMSGRGATGVMRVDTGTLTRVWDSMVEGLKWYRDSTVAEWRVADTLSSGPTNMYIFLDHVLVSTYLSGTNEMVFHKFYDQFSVDFEQDPSKIIPIEQVVPKLGIKLTERKTVLPGPVIGLSPVVVSDYPWKDLFIMSRNGSLLPTDILRRFDKKSVVPQYLLPEPKSQTEVRGGNTIIGGKEVREFQVISDETINSWYVGHNQISGTSIYNFRVVDRYGVNGSVATSTILVSSNGFWPSISLHVDGYVVSYSEYFNTFTEIHDVVTRKYNKDNVMGWEERVSLPDILSNRSSNDQEAINNPFDVYPVPEVRQVISSTTFYPRVRVIGDTAHTGFVRFNRRLSLYSRRVDNGRLLTRFFNTLFRPDRPNNLIVTGLRDLFVGELDIDDKTIKILKFEVNLSGSVYKWTWTGDDPQLINANDPDSEQASNKTFLRMAQSTNGQLNVSYQAEIKSDPQNATYTRINTTVTITFTNPHGYGLGEYVWVEFYNNAIPGSSPKLTLEGRRYLTTAVTPTTLTITVPDPSSTSTSGRVRVKNTQVESRGDDGAGIYRVRLFSLATANNPSRIWARNNIIRGQEIGKQFPVIPDPTTLVEPLEPINVSSLMAEGSFIMVTKVFSEEIDHDDNPTTPSIIAIFNTVYSLARNGLQPRTNHYIEIVQGPAKYETRFTKLPYVLVNRSEGWLLNVYIDMDDVPRFYFTNYAIGAVRVEFNNDGEAIQPDGETGYNYWWRPLLQVNSSICTRGGLTATYVNGSYQGSLREWHSNGLLARGIDYSTFNNLSVRATVLGTTAASYLRITTGRTTVSRTGHGLSVGNRIFVRYLSGVASNKIFTITEVSANSFVYLDSRTSATKGDLTYTLLTSTLVLYSRDRDGLVTITWNSHGLNVGSRILLEFGNNGGAREYEVYERVSNNVVRVHDGRVTEFTDNAQWKLDYNRSIEPTIRKTFQLPKIPDNLIVLPDRTAVLASRGVFNVNGAQDGNYREFYPDKFFVYRANRTKDSTVTDQLSFKVNEYLLYISTRDATYFVMKNYLGEVGLVDTSDLDLPVSLVPTSRELTYDVNPKGEIIKVGFEDTYYPTIRPPPPIIPSSWSTPSSTVTLVSGFQTVTVNNQDIPTATNLDFNYLVNTSNPITLVSGRFTPSITDQYMVEIPSARVVDRPNLRVLLNNQPVDLSADPNFYPAFITTQVLTKEVEATISAKEVQTLVYNYEDGTGGTDPGFTRIAFNSSNFSTVTKILVSTVDINQLDVETDLTNFSVGNSVIVEDAKNPSLRALYSVTGVTNLVTHYELNVINDSTTEPGITAPEFTVFRGEQSGSLVIKRFFDLQRLSTGVIRVTGQATHGLVSGDFVYVNVLSGSFVTGVYRVTNVVNPFEFETLDGYSAPASGTSVISKNVSRSGSYTRATTGIVTIVSNGHGYSNGQTVFIKFVQNGVFTRDGEYVVSVINSNQFTIQTDIFTSASGHVVLGNASRTSPSSVLTITQPSHGYSNGDLVYLLVVSGLINNVVKPVTVVDANTFTITDPNVTASTKGIVIPTLPSGTYVKDIEGLVTVTTSSGHGLTDGNEIYADIISVSPDNPLGNIIDGSFTIDSTTATNFTFQDVPVIIRSRVNFRRVVQTLSMSNSRAYRKTDFLNPADDSTMQLTFELPFAGDYRILLNFLKSSISGRVRMFDALDVQIPIETGITDPFDLYRPNVNTITQFIPQYVELRNQAVGTKTIKLKVSGKNPDSLGKIIGVSLFGVLYKFDQNNVYGNRKSQVEYSTTGVRKSNYVEFPDQLSIFYQVVPNGYLRFKEIDELGRYVMVSYSGTETTYPVGSIVTGSRKVAYYANTSSTVGELGYSPGNVLEFIYGISRERYRMRNLNTSNSGEVIINNLFGIKTLEKSIVTTGLATGNFSNKLDQNFTNGNKWIRYTELQYASGNQFTRTVDYERTKPEAFMKYEEFYINGKVRFVYYLNKDRRQVYDYEERYNNNGNTIRETGNYGEDTLKTGPWTLTSSSGITTEVTNYRYGLPYGNVITYNDLLEKRGTFNVASGSSIVTVNSVNHGIAGGAEVYIDFRVSNPEVPNGKYTIFKINDNQFTVSVASPTTSVILGELYFTGLVKKKTEYAWMVFDQFEKRGTFNVASGSSLVTVSSVNHGITDGTVMYIDFKVSNPEVSNGRYAIVKVNNDTFTISLASPTTGLVSGTVYFTNIYPEARSSRDKSLREGDYTEYFQDETVKILTKYVIVKRGSYWDSVYDGSYKEWSKYTVGINSNLGFTQSGTELTITKVGHELQAGDLVTIRKQTSGTVIGVVLASGLSADSFKVSITTGDTWTGTTLFVTSVEVRRLKVEGVYTRGERVAGTWKYYRPDPINSAKVVIYKTE